MTVHVTAADVLRALSEHPTSSLGDYHAVYLSRGGPGTDDDVVLTGTALELAELAGALTGVAMSIPTETPT